MTLSKSAVECRILIYVLVIILAILFLILGFFLDILPLIITGILWIIVSLLNISFLLVYINKPLLPVNNNNNININNNREREKLIKIKNKPDKKLLDEWKITKLLYLSKCENIDDYRKMETILNEFKDEDFINQETYLLKFNKIKFKL